MLKKIITFLFLLYCGSVLFGQTSRTVPFLELNADTRTAGMGDATMGKAQGMYLYSNPSSFLQTETKVYASYSYALFPKIAAGQLGYHAASVGYRLNKQALMFGFRYIGGHTIKRINESGVEGKPIRPMDWSLDLSYAREISENFSAYLGASFIQSYLLKTAYSYSISGGAYYKKQLSLGATESNLSLGAAFYDIGARLKYGKKSYSLPSSAGIGGSWELPFHEAHKMNLAVSTRYFFLPSDASSLAAGLGLEYEMFKLAAIRAGYHLEKSNNYATLGFGLKTGYGNIDLAILLSSADVHNKTIRLGLSFEL